MIKYIRHNHISWPFERQPEVRLDTKFNSYFVEPIQPFPCYAHNKEVLQETIELLETYFRIPKPFAPDWFVLEYDGISQVNGSTNRRFDYYSPRADKLKNKRDARKERGEEPIPEEMTEWNSFIILYGKRTPIHPAMTRFVAAHEYGHAVDYYIERMMNLEPEKNLLDAEYAEVRGIKNDQNYGGARWDTNIGEIIADDFRIMVADMQVEHWPHRGRKPWQIPELHDWWDDKVKRFGS